AAFANAAAAHADNFDDTTPQIQPDRTGGIHASAAVLPVALALAEQSGASGRDLIAAYLVGVDVASRLNHAIDARHYADGFHTTGTLSVFGAACAAASLLGLDRERSIAAIGIAASRASGVRRNFGSMAEILHSAHAAENGLAAADLASRGLSSAEDALDGPTGYFSAAAGAFHETVR
ncbi:MAG: MmgE/PrpD family protein, partial [Alphaproteobacteria bacterium]|nr:MmgE/PrpD family protein [Alphaproteobacteria bacterium]